MNARVEEYGKGKDKRWRVVAANGRKLANGGQGYSRRIDMERAMKATAEAIADYFAEHGPTNAERNARLLSRQQAGIDARNIKERRLALLGARLLRPA